MREFIVQIAASLGIRDAVLAMLHRLGYLLVRVEPQGPAGTADIPDANCYQPLFVPWLCDAEFNRVFGFAAPSTIVSTPSCYTLWTLARQAAHLQGDFVECGVYKGGSARLLAEAVRAVGVQKRIHLFDTFQGMPTTSTADLHQQGDFADTSVQAVQAVLRSFPNVMLHPGHIPETFREIESMSSIALAHIDVDIFQSVIDCCEFVYPRVVSGGFIIFDDYGYPSCPGARQAVDSFFADKPEWPLVLPNAQAIIIRSES
jgi:O-methyltransferase